VNFLTELKQPKESTVFIDELTRLQSSTEKWKKTYRPSTVSRVFCPRLWALIDLGYVSAYKKVSANLQRIFDNGTYMHYRYHEYAKNMGRVYRDERYGDPDNDFRCQERHLDHPSGIKGTYDLILERDGVLYVTDFKSINQENFNTLDRPKPQHVKQIIMYMGMVEDLYDLPLPIAGLYIYENKNNQKLKEFKVPWNDASRQSFQNLLAHISETERAIKAKEVDTLPCLCERNPCANWSIEWLKDNPQEIYL
jgi:hypothetical protein